MNDIAAKQEYVRQSSAREGILREARRLIRVVVENVQTTSNGMSATLRHIPSRGFASCRREVFPIRSSWEYFAFGDHCWTCAMVSWTLYFDDRLVKAAVEYAAGLPDDADIYDGVMTFIRGYQHNAPGSNEYDALNRAD